MSSKIVRLSKALRNETVKRLPWIFLVFVVLLFAQFVRFNAQTAENTRIVRSNSVDTKTLLQKVADLSAANKQLTEQNLVLSKLTNDHVDCLAKLFARYTQENRSVTYNDLTTCVIVTKSSTPTSQAKTPTPSKATRQPSASQPASSSSSSQQQSSSTRTSGDIYNRVVSPLLQSLTEGIL